MKACIFFILIKNNGLSLNQVIGNLSNRKIKKILKLEMDL